MKSIADLTAIQAKRFGVYRCLPEDTLHDAAAQMTERSISALVVTDRDGLLRGVITRMDLLRACCEREDWEYRPVGEFMSGDVVTVDPEERLSHVMELLVEHGIHRAVVVSTAKKGRRPVAVLSAADVLYHLTRPGQEG